MGAFATMEKRRQKSSPFSPREGKRVSSVFPRMMGRARGSFSENLMDDGEGEGVGRMKAGVMGVIGGWSG